MHYVLHFQDKISYTELPVIWRFLFVVDDIIKMEKKTKSAAAKARGRGKVSALRPSLNRGKRVSALRPSLAKPMKSRQSSAALAIFQKARRTAAIAAKVAADAAAFVAPVNNTPQVAPRFGGKLSLYISSEPAYP